MTNRNGVWALAAALALTLSATPATWAKEAGKAVVVSSADLEWTDAGVPKVSIAAVQGNMSKGASHFFLRYGAGIVTPVHHHTADHYVTVVSGTLLLTTDGTEKRLGPGSFFALTGKAKHSARVEDEDCVMLVDARSAWDVVPETQTAAKP